MTQMQDAHQQNQKLVDQLSDEALYDPTHPYRGKHVAVVNGNVAVVADSLKELVEELRRTNADPEETLCFEGGVDYQAVEDIWSHP